MNQKQNTEELPKQQKTIDVQREVISHIKKAATLQRQEAEETLKAISDAGDDELNQIIALLQCLTIKTKYKVLLDQERAFAESKIKTLQGFKSN